MKKLSKYVAGMGASTAFMPLLAYAQDYEFNYSTDSATAGAAAGGILAGAFIIWAIILVLALGFFIFWIFMLVDALKRTNWKQESDKTLWIVLLIVGIVTGLYGIMALVYYFAIKRPLDAGSKAGSAPTQSAQK